MALSFAKVAEGFTTMLLATREAVVEACGTNGPIGTRALHTRTRVRLHCATLKIRVCHTSDQGSGPSQSFTKTQTFIASFSMRIWNSNCFRRRRGSRICSSASSVINARRRRLLKHVGGHQTNAWNELDWLTLTRTAIIRSENNVDVDVRGIEGTRVLS